MVSEELPKRSVMSVPSPVKTPVEPPSASNWLSSEVVPEAGAVVVVGTVAVVVEDLL